MKTTMKRDTIIMTAQHVAVTGSRVWMRADEITALFDTTAAAVERTIRSLWKQGLLNADEQMRSLPSGGGRTVDVHGKEASLRLVHLPAVVGQRAVERMPYCNFGNHC